MSCSLGVADGETIHTHGNPKGVDTTGLNQWATPPLPFHPLLDQGLCGNQDVKKDVTATTIQ